MTVFCQNFPCQTFLLTIANVVPATVLSIFYFSNFLVLIHFCHQKFVLYVATFTLSMVSVIKKLKEKSSKTCLTNHIGSISHHITLTVIDALGVDTHMHIQYQCCRQKKFKNCLDHSQFKMYCRNDNNANDM